MKQINFTVLIIAAAILTVFFSWQHPKLADGQEVARVQKWEYKIIDLDALEDGNVLGKGVDRKLIERQMVAIFEKLGNDGWEYIDTSTIRFATFTRAK